VSDPLSHRLAGAGVRGLQSFQLQSRARGGPILGMSGEGDESGTGVASGGARTSVEMALAKASGAEPRRQTSNVRGEFSSSKVSVKASAPSLATETGTKEPSSAVRKDSVMSSLRNRVLFAKGYKFAKATGNKSSARVAPAAGAGTDGGDSSSGSYDSTTRRISKMNSLAGIAKLMTSAQGGGKSGSFAKQLRRKQDFGGAFKQRKGGRGVRRAVDAFKSRNVKQSIDDTGSVLGSGMLGGFRAPMSAGASGGFKKMKAAARMAIMFRKDPAEDVTTSSQSERSSASFTRSDTASFVGDAANAQHPDAMEEEEEEDEAERMGRVCRRLLPKAPVCARSLQWAFIDFTVSCDGRFNSLWECLIILLVLWNAIWIPIVVGFNPETSATVNTLNNVIDGFFWAGTLIGVGSKLR